jgi:hypothetical protein
MHFTIATLIARTLASFTHTHPFNALTSAQSQPPPSLKSPPTPRVPRTSVPATARSSSPAAASPTPTVAPLAARRWLLPATACALLRQRATRMERRDVDSATRTLQQSSLQPRRRSRSRVSRGLLGASRGLEKTESGLTELDHDEYDGVKTKITV